MTEVETVLTDQDPTARQWPLRRLARCSDTVNLSIEDHISVFALGSAVASGSVAACVTDAVALGSGNEGGLYIVDCGITSGLISGAVVALGSWSNAITVSRASKARRQGRPISLEDARRNAVSALIAAERRREVAAQQEAALLDEFEL